MEKYIIKYTYRTEKHYICNYDESYIITQISKSYSSGVKEFSSKKEAEDVAKKLKVSGYSTTQSLRDYQVIKVN